MIRDGLVLEDALRKRASTATIDAILRTNGVLDASEVELAVLEINGSMSVIPRSR